MAAGITYLERERRHWNWTRRRRRAPRHRQRRTFLDILHTRAPQIVSMAYRKLKPPPFPRER